MLDVMGRLLVWLFHHDNTSRFLQLLLESGMCDARRLPVTHRASPVAFETERAIGLMNANQVSTLAVIQRKEDWLANISFSMGSLKT